MITKQPENASAVLGGTVNVSIEATGDGLTYQWYIKNPSQTRFGKSSTTTKNYSVKMTNANNGRQMYCVITDADGNTVKSETATITVAE